MKNIFSNIRSLPLFIILLISACSRNDIKLEQALEEWRSACYDLCKGDIDMAYLCDDYEQSSFFAAMEVNRRMKEVTPQSFGRLTTLPIYDPAIILKLPYAYCSTYCQGSVINMRNRGDGNSIQPGLTYSLYYWDTDQWKCIGTKTATDVFADFEHAPRKALFAIKCSEGEEQRIFTCDENNKISWY